jgi:hypothetical protein
MRITRTTIVASLLISPAVHTQSANPRTFLSDVIAANPPLATIQSVKLDGKAQWTAGSEHESGSVSIQAAADGSSTLALSLGKSSRTETRGALSSRTCQVTTGDGKAHDLKGPECYRVVPWFAPMLLVTPTSFLADKITVTDDGDVERTGTTYHELSYVTTVPSPDPASQKLFTSSTGVKVLYDPVTLLPAGREFDEHPSTNLNQAIHVRIAYSAYQMVGGVKVPYQIDRYVNNSLQLSITLSNVTLN